MKRLLFLFIIALSFTDAVSQIQLQDGMNQNLMLIPLKESTTLNDLEGSPYLQDDFTRGSVFIEDKEPLEVFLKYNVHQEQIELKPSLDSEETFLLPKKKDIVYQLGDERFVLDEIEFEGKKVFGYFIEHFNGENYRLLEKPTISVMEAVKAKTGYEKDQPARLVIESEFYLINDDKVQNISLRHRTIKKQFDTASAKSYLSDHKIRSTEDFVNFLSYLDKN